VSIKILGGELKGLPLFVPENLNTRPTSVLLKRRLFDSFQNFSGISFFDICAGTGSVGFEALSRGAESVVFVEPYSPARKVLLKNGNLVKSKGRELGRISYDKRKFEKWIPSFFSRYNELSLDAKRSTILFFDPPYEQHSLYLTFLSSFLEHYDFQGYLWVETDSKKGPPESLWNFYFERLDKSFKQGTRIIYIFS